MVGGGCTVALLCSLPFTGKAPSHGLQNVQEHLLLSLKRVLANCHSYPILVVGPSVFATYFVVQSTIGKKFLTDCYSLRPELASTYTFCMMLTAMSSAIAGGFLSRWLGNRRKPILVISTLFNAIAGLLIIFALTHQLASEWILAAYMLFGASSCASVISCCSMKEVNHAGAAATSVGTLNGAAYVLVAILVTCSGLVLGLYREQALVTPAAIVYPVEAYRTLFAGMLAISVCAFVSSLFIRETYGCNVSDAPLR